MIDLKAEPPAGVEVLDITGVSGYGPPESVLSLASWGAWRWAMPLATLLRVASPPRVVHALPQPPVKGQAITVSTRVGAGSVTLRREPPARDLLPLVLDVVASASGCVLVLVPSTGWAERMTERLRRRGILVATDWAEAAAGWPVVVGSRAAAWAPVPRLDAAVVLDAHDYHDRYDAADVVAERAARDGARCLLVSPCPTAVQVARYGPVVVQERSVERNGWPAVTIADMRAADPRTGLLSEELVRLVRRALPGRVVCVLNRTGRARLLACARCGELARCASCGQPVESLDDAVLRCRSCGTERPRMCAACGGTRLKVLRMGVSRLREELEALIGVPVAEISASTPKGDDAVHDEPGRAGSAVVPDGVLVGTEAVLHRVRHASLVAFVDFDQHLLGARFMAGEQALALVARAGRLVGGRAGLGTGESRGTVFIQTRLPEHPVVRAAVAGDPGIATELELRRELSLPPASALAVVRSPERPVLADVEVSQLPDGRWLVRAPDHQVLCDALQPLGGGARVDPDDV